MKNFHDKPLPPGNAMEVSELQNDVKQLEATVKCAEGTIEHLRRAIRQYEAELQLAYAYIGAMACREQAAKQHPLPN